MHAASGYGQEVVWQSFHMPWILTLLQGNETHIIIRPKNYPILNEYVEEAAECMHHDKNTKISFLHLYSVKWSANGLKLLCYIFTDLNMAHFVSTCFCITTAFKQPVCQIWKNSSRNQNWQLTRLWEYSICMKEWCYPRWRERRNKNGWEIQARC